MRARTRLFILVSAAAVLPLFAGAAAASAAPTDATVKAVTHTAQHPDTCACVTSDPGTGGGYVWAYDNLSRQFDVTPTGDPNTYKVDITDTGSFAAFSEPNNPDNLFIDHPISATGSVRGTYTLTVVDAEGPDPSALPSQVGSNLSTTQTVNKLFGGNATSITGGAYTYTYRSGGETYVQDSVNGITGDITGH